MSSARGVNNYDLELPQLPALGLQFVHAHHVYLLFGF